MENSKIILSIVVPVYNVAPYLRKCVDSLLAQDYDDYELILVDDGSTDGSGEICDEYASTPYTVHHTPQIRVIHRENGGLSAARNSGIAVAQGDYVCFVDSDDYWQPNVLGGLMAQIERDNLDVLRFRLQYVNAQGEVYNPYKTDPFVGNDYSVEPADGITFLNRRMNTQCYAWTFIIKRSLIEGASPLSTFDSPLSPVLFTPGIFYEDTDWTPRMLAKAQRVASTQTVVYNYLVRLGSITNATDRAKQQKVLDDKMRLVGALQRQAETLRAEGEETSWFGRMIAATVISIIGILSTDFYALRKQYLAQLFEMQIFPLKMGYHQSKMKIRLINLSPRLAVDLLHWKNGRSRL